MISYTTGNLLEANTEALVNTVNTVGVMGKGIALMFKKQFPENMQEYVKACKAGEVQTGKMFVTSTNNLVGAKWIVNFPTKKHWRNSSKIEWIEEGLYDLRKFIIENDIKSIAIPPLGCSNGKLDWREVKPKIVDVLGDLKNTNIIIYEPLQKDSQTLTPARAMVLELFRRYLLLGDDCTQIEAQKLIYFLERSICLAKLDNPFNLKFKEYKFGPYDKRIKKVLDDMSDDYLYIKKEKKTSFSPTIYYIKINNNLITNIENYLKDYDERYNYVLDQVSCIIEGFESPYGMELIATVDWLINEKNIPPTVNDIKRGLKNWFVESGENKWAERKLRIFNDKALELAIERLEGFSY